MVIFFTVNIALVGADTSQTYLNFAEKWTPASSLSRCQQALCCLSVGKDLWVIPEVIVISTNKLRSTGMA